MTAIFLQAFGLFLDLVGVIYIANGLRKIRYKESSPYGKSVNLESILNEIANAPLCGTYILILGFLFQFAGLLCTMFEL